MNFDIVHFVYFAIFLEVILVSYLTLQTKCKDPASKTIFNYLNFGVLLLDFLVFCVVLNSLSNMNSVLKDIDANYIYLNGAKLSFYAILPIFMWGLCLFRNNHLLEKYSDKPILLENKQVKLLTKELEELKIDKKKNRNTISSLHESLMIKDNQYDELKRKYDDKNKKYQNISKEFEYEKNKNADLNNEINNLKKFEDSLKREKADLIAERDSKSNHISNITDKYKKLQEKENYYINKIEDLSTQLDSERENNSYFIKEFNEQIETLENDNQSLLKKISAIKQASVNNEIFSSVKQELEIVKKNDNDQKIEINNLNNTIKSKTDLINKQQKIIADLQNHQKENADHLTSNYSRINNLESKNKEYEKTILDKQNEIAALMQKVSEQTILIDKTKKDKEKIENEKNIFLTKYELKNKELNEIKNQLNEAISLNDDYKVKIEELEKSIEIKEKNKSNLEKVIEKNKTDKGKINKAEDSFNIDFVSTYYEELKKRKGKKKGGKG